MPTDAHVTSDRRQRAPKGEGEQLRGELMDAAEALLLQEGSMRNVSVRAIADAVGVTPPSLYLHFGDKDELFFDVAQRRFAEFEQVLRAAGEGIDDPLDRLAAMGRAYVKFGVERAEHYELIFGPECQEVARGRDLTDTAGTRAFGMVVEAVADAVEAGDLTADPWLATMTLWSAVHGAVMLLLTKGTLDDSFPMPDPATLADHVCRTIVAGLSTG